MSNPIKIIVSDLHIGAGFEEAGNVLEDFISDAEFQTFLHELVQESEARQAPLELIINGDFVEMLQVPATEIFDPLARYRAQAYADTTEAGAAHKIHHVIQGHPAVFTALADFINPGPPRRNVTITKGNHDPEQYWPAWQEAVRRAVGATGGLADLLAFEAVAIEREGLYVEHGNQYLGPLDSFDDFAAPLDPADPLRIALPLGSQFGLRAVNEIERDRFWVDSIYPATALAWFLLRWDFIFAAQALAAFLAAGIDIISRQPGRRGPADPAVTALLADLQDEDQMAEMAGRYEQDPAFQAAFNRRVWQALEAVDATEGLPLEPVRGGQVDAQRMGREILDASVRELREAAAIKARQPGVRIVSFGHTHVAEQIDLDGGAVYINTGTWIWRGDFSQAHEATWRDLLANPRKYARERRLHYARIDYDDEGQPCGQLLLYEPASAASVGSASAG